MELNDTHHKISDIPKGENYNWCHCLKTYKENISILVINHH